MIASLHAMKVSYLEFEKPLAELDSKIAELETLSGRKDGPSISDELTKLKAKGDGLGKSVLPGKHGGQSGANF